MTEYSKKKQTLAETSVIIKKDKKKGDWEDRQPWKLGWKTMLDCMISKVYIYKF